MTRFRFRAVPVLSALLALGAALPAQERPLAITHARVLTMAGGKPLEDATVLMRGGTITALGTDVEIPPGAEVVDAKGGTLMPGLVSAYSRAGLDAKSSQEPAEFNSRRWRSRGSRGSAEKAKNAAATKVADTVYAREEVYHDLLKCGVTTLALRPDGKGFPGLGAVIDPAGKTRENLIADEEAFVVIAPANGTANKKLLGDGFDAAKKLIEERKKPAEPAAKEEKKAEPDAGKAEADKKAESEAKPAPKDGEKKKEEKGEKEKKAEDAGEGKDRKKGRPKKKDPNTEILADLLEGKRRAFLEIDSAAALTHFLDAAAATSVPERVFVTTDYSSTEGRLDEVIDVLLPHKAPILTDTSLSSAPYSRAVINPAARLAAAGFDVGFVLGDDVDDLRGLFFELIELVRYGLDREVALAGVTRVPAMALGVDDRVGTIAVERDADLLLFDRDPLDPAAKLVAVWHKGQKVEDVE